MTNKTIKINKIQAVILLLITSLLLFFAVNDNPLARLTQSIFFCIFILLYIFFVKRTYQGTISVVIPLSFFVIALLSGYTQSTIIGIDLLDESGKYLVEDIPVFKNEFIFNSEFINYKMIAFSIYSFILLYSINNKHLILEKKEIDEDKELV